MRRCRRPTSTITITNTATTINTRPSTGARGRQRRLGQQVVPERRVGRWRPRSSTLRRLPIHPRRFRLSLLRSRPRPCSCLSPPRRYRSV